MKALPPALVLFATALFAASFGACGTNGPQQDSLPRSPNSDSDISHIDPASPTLSQTPNAPFQTPAITEPSPATSPEPASAAPYLPNLQTDPAFVPERSYATSVITVIDGDTITAMVDGKQMSIRLIGIDTPESSTSTRPEECGGEEASQFLRSTLPRGTPILLTRDQELLDPYDRLLAYVSEKRRPIRQPSNGQIRHGRRTLFPAQHPPHHPHPQSSNSRPHLRHRSVGAVRQH